MVRLRLARLGRRNRPFYRLHAIEKRNRRNGAVLEQLGWYDPVASDPEKQLQLNAERITHWLSQGAQPSETVADLLAKHDLLPPKMKAKWEADRKAASERTAAIKVAKEAEAKAAEEAARAAAEAKARAEAEKAAAAAKAAEEKAAAAQTPAG
ncbi:MAG: 30S ribosomal protein S16 [Phycisphaerales bacterium]|nr:30S ribosomal protein S16 [Phycisphaerales bacterium]